MQRSQFIRPIPLGTLVLIAFSCGSTGLTGQGGRPDQDPAAKVADLEAHTVADKTAGGQQENQDAKVQVADTPIPVTGANLISTSLLCKIQTENGTSVSTSCHLGFRKPGIFIPAGSIAPELGIVWNEPSISGAIAVEGCSNDGLYLTQTCELTVSGAGSIQFGALLNDSLTAVQHLADGEMTFPDESTAGVSAKVFENPNFLFTTLAYRGAPISNSVTISGGGGLPSQTINFGNFYSNGRIEYRSLNMEGIVSGFAWDPTSDTAYLAMGGAVALYDDRGEIKLPIFPAGYGILNQVAYDSNRKRILAWTDRNIVLYLDNANTVSRTTWQPFQGGDQAGSSAVVYHGADDRIYRLQMATGINGQSMTYTVTLLQHNAGTLEFEGSLSFQPITLPLQSSYGAQLVSDGSRLYLVTNNVELNSNTVVHHVYGLGADGSTPEQIR